MRTTFNERRSANPVRRGSPPGPEGRGAPGGLNLNDPTRAADHSPMRETLTCQLRGRPHATALDWDVRT
jgi:hypothetical protein